MVRDPNIFFQKLKPLLGNPSFEITDKAPDKVALRYHLMSGEAGGGQKVMIPMPKKSRRMKMRRLKKRRKKVVAVYK